MSFSLRTKLIAAFLLVFIAGGVSGIVLFRQHGGGMFFGPARSGALPEHMREHLRRELDLSPEQMNRLTPVIDETAAKLESIRSETQRRVGEVFADQRKALMPALTPEQQKKLEDLARRHREQMQRRGFQPPPLHHGPPP